MIYKYKCPSKINIGLDIISKREDGYHLIDTIMSPIGLCDVLKIKKSKTTNVISSNLNIPLKDNIIYKAIMLIKQEFNIEENFVIKLKKNIPSQAGLGGGSSDAAGTILLLNKILKLNMSNEKMRILAAKLGADVPFFINYKTSRCTGIGEIIKEIKHYKKRYVLLMKPSKGCDTKLLYNEIDKSKINHPNMDEIEQNILKDNFKNLCQKIDNSFYSVVSKFVPEVEEINSIMKKEGLSCVSLSGSGSTMFALSDNKKELKKISKKYKNKFFVYVTKIL